MGNTSQGDNVSVMSDVSRTTTLHVINTTRRLISIMKLYTTLFIGTSITNTIQCWCFVRSIGE